MARSRDEYELERRRPPRSSAPEAAPALPIGALLALQASAGNQAVGRMLARRSPFKRREEATPEVAAEPEPAVEPAPVPEPPAPVEEPAPAAAPLIPAAKVEAQREIRKFASCEEARVWAGGNIEQNYSWSMRAPQGPPAVTIGERGEQVTASSPLDFRLDPATSYTHIVVPTWTGITPDEQKEVDDYVKAIQAHEDGHIAVSEQAYAAMTGVVEGVGATEADAGEDRNLKAREKVADTDAYVVYKRDEYDTLTDHGRKQSTVGGRDTVLNCPPPP